MKMREHGHAAHEPAAPRSTASPFWFWATATVLFVFVTASAAPAPLYRVYQQHWAFSDTTLTAVFAGLVISLQFAFFLARFACMSPQRPIVYRRSCLPA